MLEGERSERAFRCETVLRLEGCCAFICFVTSVVGSLCTLTSYHNIRRAAPLNATLGGMKGDVDPSLRLGVLSISPLPRNGGGTEASWVVEAKVALKLHLRRAKNFQ